MKAVFTIICFFMLSVHTQGQNMSMMSKAMLEAREVMRTTDAHEVIKNISHVALNTLSHDLTNSAPFFMRDLAPHLIHELTNSNNVRVLLRLIKESKIKRKGDLIRIIIKFMNPDNLTPEGFIHTMQSLDEVTVSEMAGIFLKYIKELAPQFFGNDSESFNRYFNYINPEDLKEITKILFEIFKDTDPDEMIWLLKRLRHGKKEALNLIGSDKKRILEAWETGRDEKLQENIKTILKDTKHVATAEKLTPHLSELTHAAKTAATHLTKQIFSDLKNTSSKHSSIKTEVENKLGFVMGYAKSLPEILKFIDVEEIGNDAESAIVYLKTLNNTKIKEMIKEFTLFLPSINDLIDYVNASDGNNFKIVSKKMTLAFLTSLKQKELPIQISDALLDNILDSIKKINEKRIKTIIDLVLAPNHQNKVTRVIVTVMKNNLRENFYNKSLHLRETKSLDDLEKAVIKAVEEVDETYLQRSVSRIIYNIQHIDEDAVSSVVIEANNLARILLSDEYLINFNNPRKLFISLNETALEHAFLLLSNSLKLINETHLLGTCKNISSVTEERINKNLEKARKNILSQFEKVPDGTEVAKMLKINETLQIFFSIVKSVGFSQTCNDVVSILKVNRVLNPEARAELVAWFTSLMKRLQKLAAGGGMDPKTLEMIEVIIDSLLKAALKTEKRDTTGKKAIRLARRGLDDYKKIGKFSLRLKNNEEEEELEKALLAEIKQEEFNSENPDLNTNLEETIVPFNPNLQLFTPHTVRIPDDRAKDNAKRFRPKKESIPEATDAFTTMVPKDSVPEATETLTTMVPEESTDVKKSTPEQNKLSRTETENRHVDLEVITKSTPEIKRQQEKSEMKKEQSQSACEKDASHLLQSKEQWAEDIRDNWLKDRYTIEPAEINDCLLLKNITKTFSMQFCKAAMDFKIEYPALQSIPEITLRIGMCIPQSCPLQDFIKLLKQRKKDAIETDHLTILEENCVTNYEEGSSFPFFKYTLAVLAVLITFSSFYEILGTIFFNQENPPKVVKAFSLGKIGLQCFTPPQKDDYFSIIYSIRLVSIFFAVGYSMLESIIALKGMTRQDVSSNDIYLAPMNIYISTNCLLFTGGAIAAISFRRFFSSGSKIWSSVKNILKKFITWTMCLGILIFLRANLQEKGTECAKFWWHHLVFIANFMEHDNQCVPQGWYLSLEMQLFVITPIILCIPIKNNSRRWITTLIISVLLIVIPIANACFVGETLTIFPVPGAEQFQKDLSKPYMRIVAWIIGAVIGDIMYNHEQSKGKRYKFSKIKWFAAIVICLGINPCLTWMGKYFTAEIRPQWQFAIFIGLTHLMTPLTLAGITIICYSGYGGFIRTLANANIVKVVGRLSFAIFLVQVAVFEYFWSQISTTKSTSNVNTVGITFLAVYNLSLPAAAIFRIIVELPIGNICDMMIGQPPEELIDSAVSSEQEDSINSAVTLGNDEKSNPASPN